MTIWVETFLRNIPHSEFKLFLINGPIIDVTQAIKDFKAVDALVEFGTYNLKVTFYNLQRKEIGEQVYNRDQILYTERVRAQ